MIKTRVYKSLALTMAFLMFFTSMGYSIDMHYCQGQLKTISIFGKSKSCHEMAAAPCAMHKDITVKQDEKDCCDNKTVIVEGQDNDKIGSQFDSISDQNLQFLTAFVFTHFFKVKVTTENIPVIQSSPPLPKSGLYIQFQQFLI